MHAFLQPTAQKMAGTGLKRTPPKCEGKVEKPASYMPFGRFIVNKFRLKDGHLMLRTPSGGAILKLPSQRISN